MYRWHLRKVFHLGIKGKEYRQNCGFSASLISKLVVAGFGRAVSRVEDMVISRLSHLAFKERTVIPMKCIKGKFRMV